MQKFILSYRRGSYRKLFIVILILSFGFFIDSFINKDIPSILMCLAVFLAALKQVVIPIDLDQEIFSSKQMLTSYYNEYSIWHRAVMLGDKVSSFLFLAGILYSIVS